MDDWEAIATDEEKGDHPPSTGNNNHPGLCRRVKSLHISCFLSELKKVHIEVKEESTGQPQPAGSEEDEDEEDKGDEEEDEDDDDDEEESDEEAEKVEATSASQTKRKTARESEDESSESEDDDRTKEERLYDRAKRRIEVRNTGGVRARLLSAVSDRQEE